MRIYVLWTTDRGRISNDELRSEVVVIERGQLNAERRVCLK